MTVVTHLLFLFLFVLTFVLLFFFSSSTGSVVSPSRVFSSSSPTFSFLKSFLLQPLPDILKILTAPPTENPTALLNPHPFLARFKHSIAANVEREKAAHDLQALLMSLPPITSEAEASTSPHHSLLLPGFPSSQSLIHAVQIWQFAQAMRTNLGLEPLPLRPFLFSLFSQSLESSHVRKVGAHHSMAFRLFYLVDGVRNP